MKRREAPLPISELTDNDIWLLVQKWFVAEQREASACLPSDGYETLQDAEQDLDMLIDYEPMAGTYQAMADTLLGEEGWVIESGSRSRLKLAERLHLEHFC